MSKVLRGILLDLNRSLWSSSVNAEANSVMTRGLSVFSGAGKLLWCSYDPKTDSAGHRGWRTKGNEVSIDDLVWNIVWSMGEAAYEGLCCFVQFCLVSSPLFFFLFFSFQHGNFRWQYRHLYTGCGFFFFSFDNNWKLFLYFFITYRVPFIHLL